MDCQVSNTYKSNAWATNNLAPVDMLFWSIVKYLKFIILAFLFIIFFLKNKNLLLVWEICGGLAKTGPARIYAYVLTHLFEAL